MTKRTPYISLLEASKHSLYSQEYLSLRARQGKLKAVKRGRNWATTREWVREYEKSVSRSFSSNIGARFFAMSAGALVLVALLVSTAFGKTAISAVSGQAIDVVSVVDANLADRVQELSRGGAFWAGNAFGMESVAIVARSLDVRVQRAAELAREEFLAIPSQASRTLMEAVSFADAFAQEFRSNIHVALVHAKGVAFHADLLFSLPAENFRFNLPLALNAALSTPGAALGAFDEASSDGADNARLLLASSGSLLKDYFSWFRQSVINLPRSDADIDAVISQRLARERASIVLSPLPL
ncbi:MAG: hypothetical protein HYS59_01350, partial [Candidatus Vogelbacteria bacterium]|nr:hypothetical protein [Candidatus Vogelbacteria bacterium]